MIDKYKQTLEGMLLAFFSGPVVGYLCGIAYRGLYWSKYGDNGLIYYHPLFGVVIGLFFAFIYYLNIEKVGFWSFVVFMLNFLPTFNIALGKMPRPIFLYVSLALFVLTAYLYARKLAKIKSEDKP